jgi:hypothetical protein
MHLYRWENKTEIDSGDLVEIDEALTSLGAIIHFQRALSDQEVGQLVSDAIQRLQIYAQRIGARADCD